MSSDIVDVFDAQYFLDKGHTVITQKELQPFYRFICRLIQQENYSKINQIMEPDCAYEYSLLLCLTLLRLTRLDKEKIKNWQRFKLVAQYVAYQSQTEKDLKSMFMGL